MRLNSNNQISSDIFSKFQDKPIPRRGGIAAKLPTPGPDRYLVQKQNDKWVPLKSNELEQALSQKTPIGIWQDQRQQSKPDGKIDLNEIENITVFNPDSSLPTKEGMTLVASPLPEKGKYQKPEWQIIDNTLSSLEQRSMVAEWQDQPQLSAKDGLIQDNEVSVIDSQSANLLLQETDKVLKQLTAQASANKPLIDLAELISDKPIAGDKAIADIIPQVGNGGYDVQHYNVDLTLTNPKTADLKTKVTLDAIAHSNLKEFTLDFKPFDYVKVTVNGNKAQFNMQDDELTVKPQTALKHNEPFQVEIEYEGSPSVVRESLIHGTEVGLKNHQGTLTTLGEPRGNKNWLPSNNHPSDKATYDFSITTPQNYTSSANGPLTEKMTNPDGTVTSKFTMDSPMASYLAGINIWETDKYDSWTQPSVNGVSIEHSAPKNADPLIRETLNKTPKMLNFLESWMGPYPFKNLGNHVFDKFFSGGLEVQSRNVYGSAVVADPSFGTEVVAHETAHQWFGDSVSIKKWQDIWLKEAFATYFGIAYLAHEEAAKSGISEAEAMDKIFEKRYAYARNHKTSEPGDPKPETMYSYQHYLKMAAGVHALRKTVGDEQFRDIITTFTQTYKDQSVEVTDFIKVAQDVSQKDLTQLFDTWVYSERQPRDFPGSVSGFRTVAIDDTQPPVS